MSKTEINFLDTTVFKVDNKLRTKLYLKPTDRKSYLHFKSEHPNSTKESIAYSQAIRLKKIATVEALLITTVNGYLTR